MNQQRDKSIHEERNTLIEGYEAELELAKKVESENAQVLLIAEAEAYLMSATRTSTWSL